MTKQLRLLAVALCLSCPAWAELPKLSYNPSHAEMVRYVVAAAKATDWISVASIGTSVRGRTIPVVICHDPAATPSDMTRLLVLCRQHGNEPAGTVAMLGMIRDIVAGNPALRSELSRVCLLIVPMVNPDGADADQRHNARDVDLNRDWQNRTQPETQAVEYLFDLWKPHTVLDLHELHWHDAHGLNTIEAPEGGVVIESQGQESRELQSAVLARLQEAGFPVRISRWDSSSNMNLCHRHYAKNHGAVTLLFESERQGFRTELPRRAQMHRIGVQTVLDYYASDRAPTFPRLALGPAAPALGLTDAAPAEPAAPVVTAPQIDVRSPNLAQPIAPTAKVVVNLANLDDLKYLTVRVDGQSRFFCNRAPFDFDLSGLHLTDGTHVLLFRAVRTDESVVEREYVVTVQAP